MIDVDHIAHQAARRWFLSEGSQDWATCPITQNGVIRIAGHSSYPGATVDPAIVSDVLNRLCGLPGHSFWADGISLLDSSRIDLARIGSAGRSTDAYLLALAISNGGNLATLDHRLSAAPVVGGEQALRLIA